MTGADLDSMAPRAAGRPAVFLDKDGTVIVDEPYNVDPRRMRLTPGALEGLQALHRAGYLLVVVSNQSGVARGYFTEEALGPVEARLRALLAAAGVPLAAFLWCPHHPDGPVAAYALRCSCRKPASGLLLRAAQEYGIDLARSWMIGDILHDVEAGKRAGCRTILMDVGNETEWQQSPERTPDTTVADLREAAQVILRGSEVFPGLGGEVSALIEHFSSKRVLVIGEAMLDTYFIGTSTRLCQEAPAPVVAVHERHDAPGGAANTAVNLAALGCSVELLSVVGDDDEGRRLRDLLQQRGVDLDLLAVAAARQTLAKQRVFNGDHLVVRFDQGHADPIPPVIERWLCKRLMAAFMQVDAVIVSDYAYGVLTDSVLDHLRALQRRFGQCLAVDARDLRRYQPLGVTLVKPNFAEALALVGQAASAPAGPRTDVAAALGGAVLERTGARIAAITLDADGAVVVERDRRPYWTTATPANQARTAGAGDTYLAAFALCLATGADTPRAAELAARAAGVVVQRDGTSVCTAEALRRVCADLPPGGQAGSPPPMDLDTFQPPRERDDRRTPAVGADLGAREAASLHPA